jgi:hypothetical protein
MCLLEKDLLKSHLIPAALYDYCRQADFAPVRVGNGVVFATDRQTQDYLLCRDCETILNQGGESWVNPRLCTMERKFPLYDLLAKLPNYMADDDAALYHLPDDSIIDFQKLTHFGMGIFWKAAVHSWKGDSVEPMIELGPYADQIRRWLIDEADFPEHVQLWVSMSRPEYAQIALNPPVQTSKTNWRTFLMHVLGLMYQLNIGAGMDAATRETCFYRNPGHPIMVSTELTKQWEAKLAKHYNESRKTQTYLQAKAKRDARKRKM